MKNKLLTAFVILLVSSFLLTGCIGVNRQFSEIKDKIMGNMGENYKTEFQFSVGSAAIHISSWFVQLSADQEYVDDMMREISSVQVGVYNRIEVSEMQPDFSTLQAIDDEMTVRGWKYIVRSVEGSELTAIYVNADPEEALKDMYVINFSDDELVIVEVKGDLKKVISYAIEEREFNLKM